MFSEFTGQLKVRARLELMVEGRKETRRRARTHFVERSVRPRQNHARYIIANAMGVNVKTPADP